MSNTRGWEDYTRLGRHLNVRYIREPLSHPGGEETWTWALRKLDMGSLEMDMSTLVWSFTRKTILRWENPGGNQVEPRG